MVRLRHSRCGNHAPTVFHDGRLYTGDTAEFFNLVLNSNSLRGKHNLVDLRQSQVVSSPPASSSDDRRAWPYFGIGARTGLSESAGGRHPKRHRGYRQRACCSWRSRTTGTKGRLRPFQQCSAVSRCRGLQSSPTSSVPTWLDCIQGSRLIGISNDVRAERLAASSKTPKSPVHIDQDHSAGDMQ
jgi:hypothetical protein